MDVEHDYRNDVPRPEPSSHMLDGDDRWFDTAADPQDIASRDRQLKIIAGVGLLAALITVSVYAAEAIINRSALPAPFARYALIANGVLAAFGAGAIGLLYRDVPGDRMAAMILGGLLGLLAYGLATAALCLVLLFLACPITLIMELG